jgi:ribosomal protein S18 acetylase RimI-like enzyme
MPAAIQRPTPPAQNATITSVDGLARRVNVEVRPMEPRDIRDVVELHRTLLPDWFVAAAGRRFLELFYSEALKMGEIAYVAIQEGLVAGFVMGSVRPHSFSRSLLRSHAFDLLLAGAVATVGSPRSWPRIAAAALKPFLREETAHSPAATLMFIAVSPWTESAGIGRRLVDAFVREAGRRNAGSIMLTTRMFDNERANRFYRRLGFTAVAERRRGDREWVRDYQLDLSGR